jgi:hypothetical protein
VKLPSSPQELPTTVERLADGGCILRQGTAAIPLTAAQLDALITYSRGLPVAESPAKVHARLCRYISKQS